MVPEVASTVDRAVGLVAAHVREVDRKQPPDLLGDRREHLLGRHPAGHQRRDPPQRRLLLREPGERRATLRVRDRRRHKLGERREARLDVRRERLLRASSRAAITPHSRPSTMIGVPDRWADARPRER